jgi:hypothetical protein
LPLEGLPRIVGHPFLRADVLEWKN